MLILLVCDCLFHPDLDFVESHELYDGNGYEVYRCPLCKSEWTCGYDLKITGKTKLHDELQEYGRIMMRYIEKRIDEILDEIKGE